MQNQTFCCAISIVWYFSCNHRFDCRKHFRIGNFLLVTISPEMQDTGHTYGSIRTCSIYLSHSNTANFKIWIRYQDFSVCSSRKSVGKKKRMFILRRWHQGSKRRERRNEKKAHGNPNKWNIFQFKCKYLCYKMRIACHLVSIVYLALSLSHTQDECLLAARAALAAREHKRKINFICVNFVLDWIHDGNAERDVKCALQLK